MAWFTAATEKASHAMVLLACAGMQEDLHYDAGAGFDDDGGYVDGGYAGELSFDDLADAAASGQPAHAGMHVDNPQVGLPDHTHVALPRHASGCEVPSTLSAQAPLLSIETPTKAIIPWQKGDVAGKCWEVLSSCVRRAAEP